MLHIEMIYPVYIYIYIDEVVSNFVIQYNEYIKTHTVPPGASMKNIFLSEQ